MRRTKALELTACHEAGHAVAFHRLFPRGRDGGSLSVESDQQKGTAGRHLAEEVFFGLDEDEGVIEDYSRREAVYACAGYAACVAVGHPEDEAASGCNQDFADAERATGDVPAAKREALALMGQPENVQAVRVVADELLRLGTIEAQILDVLLEHACGGECTWADYSQFLLMAKAPSHSAR